MKTLLSFAIFLAVAVGVWSAETNIISTATREGRQTVRSDALKKYDVNRNGVLDGPERDALLQEVRTKREAARPRVSQPVAPTAPTAPARN